MTGMARLFFWGYTLMLLCIGISGILIAPWELRNVFNVPLDALVDSSQATLLNQYRFLKALEFAFGIFCVAYRRDIFDSTIAHRVFLGGLGAGVVARFGSWMADGNPKPVFLVFAVLELATGLLVWIAAQRREAIV